MYASSSEIKAYFESFAAKYDLHRYIKLNHKVVGLKWVEDKGVWHVSTSDTETNASECAPYHIVVKATGYLNEWKLPDLPDVGSFRGQIFHSASWSMGTDLRDKDVILIGNGSVFLPALDVARTNYSKRISYSNFAADTRNRAYGNKHFPFAILGRPSHWKRSPTAIYRRGNQNFP